MVKTLVREYGMVHCLGKVNYLEIMCLKCADKYVDRTKNPWQKCMEEVNVFKHHPWATSWDTSTIDFKEISSLVRCLLSRDDEYLSLIHI